MRHWTIMQQSVQLAEYCNVARFICMFVGCVHSLAGPYIHVLLTCLALRTDRYATSLDVLPSCCGLNASAAVNIANVTQQQQWQTEVVTAISSSIQALMLAGRLEQIGVAANPELVQVLRCMPEAVAACLYGMAMTLPSWELGQQQQQQQQQQEEQQEPGEVGQQQQQQQRHQQPSPAVLQLGQQQLAAAEHASVALNELLQPLQPQVGKLCYNQCHV